MRACVKKVGNEKPIYCKNYECGLIDKNDKYEKGEALFLSRCNDINRRDLDGIDFKYMIIGEV